MPFASRVKRVEIRDAFHFSAAIIIFFARLSFEKKFSNVFLCACAFGISERHFNEFAAEQTSTIGDIVRRNAISNVIVCGFSGFVPCSRPFVDGLLSHRKVVAAAAAAQKAKSFPSSQSSCHFDAADMKGLGSLLTYLCVYVREYF